MADSYACKGGRKTAGSNKPAASKESRTETRINPPAELPKLGKELGFSFRGGGWGGGDELRGWGGGCQNKGVRVHQVSACLCSSLRPTGESCAGPKKPQTLGAAESRSLGTGGEGWRRPLPFERRASGLTRWVSCRVFIVLVAKCYIKGWKGLNEFRPSAVSCVTASGMEACEWTSPGRPAS